MDGWMHSRDDKIGNLVRKPLQKKKKKKTSIGWKLETDRERRRE
jgi:hypothetical protein